MWDGDVRLQAGWGFYHRELQQGVGSEASDQLTLPAGTACGFHHTQHSLGTCMGHDPASLGAGGNCPDGWRVRYHFDMSSGRDNYDCRISDALYNPRYCGFFVWCEYIDPKGLCKKDPDCVPRAIKFATVGIMNHVDSDDPTAQFGETKQPDCTPLGMVRTPFYDDGRPAGKGLSFCCSGPTCKCN